jgi:hypothetical protein
MRFGVRDATFFVGLELAGGEPPGAARRLIREGEPLAGAAPRRLSDALILFADTQRHDSPSAVLAFVGMMIRCYAGTPLARLIREALVSADQVGNDKVCGRKRA